MNRGLLTAFRALGVLLGASLIGCSSSTDSEKLVRVQYYDVAYRTSPPEPVYSRLTWSHLPAPIRTKAKETAPMIMPSVSFEFPRSNLQEAVEAVAQTIGYNWSYPKGISGRPVAIRMVGTVEEVLQEIGRQTRVVPVLDHENRVVRILEGTPERPIEPVLPGARASSQRAQLR